jgi:hypothetical protein
MVMATRREIARVLPFPSFWPNTGEDYLFSEQVNRLGFLNAYLSPEDGWAEHAGLASQSDPANPQTFPDMLCNSVLGSWLAPGTFDDLREGMTIFWLRRYFGAPTGFQECRELWRGFRDRALAVLEGDDHAFAGPGRTPAGGNAWQERRPEDLSAVLQRLRAEKESILEFKRGEFPGKDLAGLRNACLGPLSYAARSP